jgi:hypothetical protein
MRRATAFDEASKTHIGFKHCHASEATWASGPHERRARKIVETNAEPPKAAKAQVRAAFRRAQTKFGAGNGIRTRDFDLGKVALYH